MSGEVNLVYVTHIKRELIISIRKKITVRHGSHAKTAKGEYCNVVTDRVKSLKI